MVRTTKVYSYIYFTSHEEVQAIQVKENDLLRAHSNKVKKTRQKCVKHLPTPPKRSIIVFLHNYLALLFSS